MVRVDLDSAKRRVEDEVKRRAEGLRDVAQQIHAHPELLFEERFAADLLATEIEDAGLEVERGAYGIETAFQARAGDGDGPLVAILCEYDALPGIGHGCGHNLIAAAGLGAGLAAAVVAADAGGRLIILGTPAEEGGGGKIRLIEAGAFDGVDAAMLVHPASEDLSEAHVTAGAAWRVEYDGVGAHAAASPQGGRNALDAAVLGYNAIAALRQHMMSSERVHGVFLEAGEKPNMVPHRAVAEWYIRSGAIESLQRLKERVRVCLDAGARAAGCTLRISPSCPEYAHLETNRPLLDLYRANSEAIGRPVADPTDERWVIISTDMGNVSLKVPSIHPLVAVAPHGVALHTAEFARWSASPAGEQGMLDGATAMAMTAVDVWLRPDIASEMWAAHDPAA